RAQVTLLTLAAIALVMPAAFHALAGPGGRIQEDSLSLTIALVLLASYGANLLFSLYTHRDLFAGESATPSMDEKPWTLKKSVLMLGVSTTLIAWISEILVGSVEPAAEAFGMTRIFLGVIVVAIVGNAAEHSTAILMAMKNRMELTLGI